MTDRFEPGLTNARLTDEVERLGKASEVTRWSLARCDQARTDALAEVARLTDEVTETRHTHNAAIHKTHIRILEFAENISELEAANAKLKAEYMKVEVRRLEQVRFVAELKAANAKLTKQVNPDMTNAQYHRHVAKLWAVIGDVGRHPEHDSVFDKVVAEIETLRTEVGRLTKQIASDYDPAERLEDVRAHARIADIVRILDKHQWAGVLHGTYNEARGCPECLGMHPDDSLNCGGGQFVKGKGHHPDCALAAALDKGATP